MYKHLVRMIILIPFLFSVSLYGANSPDKSNQANKKSSLPRMQYFGTMQIDKEPFDFGYTPGKVKVSHTFWVRNIGDDTLEIIRARPGCSCTQVRVPERLVPVGDSSGVEIIFSSGWYRGEINKTPSINVSDRQHSEQILHYSAYVMFDGDSVDYPLIRINPEVLDIVIGQEQDQYSLAVKNISDQPLKMTLVSTDPRTFTVTVPDEPIKPGKEANIILKLENISYYKTPGFEKSFTIELSDANHTRYTVPVHYMHESDLKPKGGYPSGWGK